ncbi:MAG: alpha-L-rhamnosidase, partial [Mucilaginibacter polytrichastri]|nr:alpha-L-rhamnosidase [Mucilaginibacter polytrichastri]
SYYGFRYALIEGIDPEGKNGSGRPVLQQVMSLHNRNSAPSNGSFSCSNPLFNRVDTLIRWAIKSNLQSVVTDCPHREKLSWLEQDHLMGESIHYNFDNRLLYRKLVQDMMDAQTGEGLVPDIAPAYTVFGGGFWDSPEWGSSAVILPWMLYRWYNDRSTMEEAFPMMKKYVDYLGTKADSGILGHGLGDWFDYGPKQPGEAQLTPKALTATAIYYYDAVLLGKMAAILGKEKEAAQYTQLAGSIRSAFNTRFFDWEKHVYATGSQTAMAMPLVVRLVEEQHRQAVVKSLTDSIKKQNYALTAGDIGFHYLVAALDQAGAPDVLFAMNNRDDVPGYGFQLRKGATALTESWPALENVSNNHLMLGHLMEWLYSGLAGISQQDSSVAYKHLRIRPQPVGDITSAQGSFHSPYGWVKTAWEMKGGRFTLRVSIPVNSRATVFLPVKKASALTENGKAIPPETVLERGSGEYVFEAVE